MKIPTRAHERKAKSQAKALVHQLAQEITPEIVKEAVGLIFTNEAAMRVFVRTLLVMDERDLKGAEMVGDKPRPAHERPFAQSAHCVAYVYHMRQIFNAAQGQSS